MGRESDEARTRAGRRWELAALIVVPIVGVILNVVAFALFAANPGKDDEVFDNLEPFAVLFGVSGILFIPYLAWLGWFVWRVRARRPVARPTDPDSE